MALIQGASAFDPLFGDGSDLHLTNERGSWTVIEEEDYLTLRNNKNDKVYKLVMEEIE